MKLNPHNNRLITNATVESQEFGIGDTAKIIAILRDKLYQDKIGSIAREIICNARDAMREVGSDEQVEVTIPTALNPVFKVRDFGPGISPDRMKNVFLLYGNSTKNDTNTQTGGWGLGAKTPFAYTDSFSIVTTINGIRRTYIAHTGESNNGRLDLLSTQETDDRNGTEIQVAVKSGDENEFREAVFRAVHFWEKRPILKGALDMPKQTKGCRIGDTLEVVDGEKDLPDQLRIASYNQDMLAVVDGIPYPISHKLIEKVDNLNRLSKLVAAEVILHFGNGVVEVSTSRESITDSKLTMAALNKLAGKVCMEVSTHISDAFGKVKDTAEYLSTYSDLSKSFNVDKFAKFGEYVINRGIIESDLLRKVNITSISCLNSRRRKTDKIFRNELSENRRALPIDGFNSVFYLGKEESKINQNNRIREYFNTSPQLWMIAPLVTCEYEQVKTADGKTESKLKSRTVDMVSYNRVLQELNAKDLQTIEYVKEVKEKNPAAAKIRRDNEEFCYSRLDYGRYQYTTLAKNSQKWLYVEMKGVQWDGYDSQELRELSHHLDEEKGIKICGLAGRALKMVEGNPNYSPFKDWLAKYQPSKADITDGKARHAENTNEGGLISRLKDLKDKELVAMGIEYKAIARSIKRLPKMLVDKIDALPEVKDFIASDKTFGKLIKSEYSLLLNVQTYNVGYAQLDEIVVYCNAKYASKKKAVD